MTGKHGTTKLLGFSIVVVGTFILSGCLEGDTGTQGPAGPDGVQGPAGPDNITQIDTGLGLTGGPITTTGTINLKLSAAGGLVKTWGIGSDELGIMPGSFDGQILRWDDSAVMWVLDMESTDATTLGGLTSSSFWQTGGNAGLIDGTDNILGTTDNVALDFIVNNERALRIEPTAAADAPNIIGGHSANSVTAGVVGATISGGGFNDGTDLWENLVTADYATIAGGSANTASGASSTIGGGGGNAASGPASTVSGGGNNTASGLYSTVGGGLGNTASSDRSTVGGGGGNTASHLYSTVGGGWFNTASGWTATVGGGFNNEASGGLATVGGGDDNTASGDRATVGGGFWNMAAADYATIAGGGPADVFDLINTNNRVFDDYGTIGGGGYNRAGSDDADTTTATFATVSGGAINNALDIYSTVSGGYGNTADSYAATVSGGYGNSASSGSSTVCGGNGNTATNLSTIGGGFFNTASGGSSTVGGGGQNTASGTNSTVGGGMNNTASGNSATVPGGLNNTAAGNYSFAAGRRANVLAAHSGTYLWADDQGSGLVFDSAAVNEFAVRATGGVRFVTAVDGGTGAPTAGVSLGSGDTSWSAISDRNKKKDFQPVAGESILDRIRSMPITTWRYIWERSDSVPHIGPVAQDFKALFYPGRDDKTISTLEFDGVAFAAIKALEQRTAQLKLENAALKARIARLEAALLSADKRK